MWQSCCDTPRDAAVTNSYLGTSRKAAAHGILQHVGSGRGERVLNVQKSAPGMRKAAALLLARFLIRKACVHVHRCAPKARGALRWESPMDTARGDFVRVLSAEDTCPQCAEVYAWVDQRVCNTCLTAVCPACVATEGAPHELLCRVCYASEEAPTRPIPRLTRVFRRAQRLSSRRYRFRRWHKARAWSRESAAHLRWARRRCAGLWTWCVRRADDMLERGTAQLRGARERCIGLSTSCVRRIGETLSGGHLLGRRLLEGSRSHVLRMRQGVRAQLRVAALVLWILFASARREAQRE